jgi:F0F1-type ATP synthase alpha subunit
LETELKHKEQQQKQQLSPSSLLIPQLKFKTAFEELCNKHALLTCGIEKIDSLLQLTSGDRLAIIGNRKYTQTLITRFCVNALLLLPSSKKTTIQQQSFLYI